MITVRSTINLAHQSVPNIIPVVQGDTGRAILFTFADFTIPEGATARYFVMKPSGLAVYNDATIDGNTVLVELTAQSIIETGDNYGQVRISVGEDIVTSFDFILHVDPFRGIDAVESTTETNIFDQAVETARETIDTMIEDAEQAIEDAAEAAEEYIAQAIDPTLSLPDKAADAKATGDAIGDLKGTLQIVNQSGTLAIKISGVTIDKNGNILNPYASTNIHGPLQVQKGDVVTVTNINCNSALAAISYCDENITTVYEVIEIGKGSSLSNEYTTTVDRDGYIAVVTSSASGTPLPNYTLYRFGLKANYDKEIEDINDELEENSISAFIDSEVSANVFDPDAVTPGYICNGYGNLESNPSVIVTDYYEVSPGDKVRFIPYQYNAAQSIFVFDSTKNIISSGYYPRTDYTDYSEITIPTGRDAKYFRLNISFRQFTDTVITINTTFSRALAGQYGKQFAIKDGIKYEGLLFGKFITYNGDSICEGRYYGNPSNGGAYANIISRITGSRAENRAISGGILASAVPSGSTPIRLIVNDITNMSSDADLVCIEGGYNDYARNVPLGEITPEKEITAESAVAELDTTTICGALESIFRQARLKWLGKPIVFIIVHKVQNSYYTNNFAATPYTFKDVHDKIVQICNKYAIPYYDACLYSGLNGHDVNQSNTYLTSNDSGTGDGTHPNEAGYRRYYVPQLIALFEKILPRL